MSVLTIATPFYTLEVGGKSALSYRVAGQREAIPFAWPRFEIDGKPTTAPEGLHEISRRQLSGEIREICLSGVLAEDVDIQMILRVCPRTPFIRFRYTLSSDRPAALTKSTGERLTYLSYLSEPDTPRMEVRFSVYDSLLHGYCLEELPAFRHENELMGPILTEQRGDVCLLTAYEHGSMYPDKFVAFVRDEDGVAIRAVRGNYWNGESIQGRPYETIWLQLGAVSGDADTLAQAYRQFQLHYCTLNRESRKPYIFYNTWAFQERNKFYNHQDYLTSMNQKRIEQEIEIAHKMGVDVFVIDTGWYEKTGDWETNLKRFPDGMKHIRDLLEDRGMKLGLWFGPTSAARSSKMLSRNPGSVAAMGGRKPDPYPIWETEESYPMCLVSEYWKDFADRLIELSRTVGVRYFKWDAVDMFGCDCADHLHGNEACSARERHDSFRFQVGLYMSKIVDRLCEAVPDAIVDMDITEGRRYFGLGFLSSGKFFSMNNGPYYPNYDIQVPEDQWINIFVNPGPARTWICRQNTAYDKWIPSVLMMAHYLPDAPESSQLINLASLMLGQNGIWGDLPGVSEEGVALFGKVLSSYKRLRSDITEAYPIVYGHSGEALEIHEKINMHTGRGLVVVFINQPGDYSYRLSSPALGQPDILGSAVLRREVDGLWLDVSSNEPCAAIFFFQGNVT